MSSDGFGQQTDAEKSLADIVGEVSQKTSLLVREEIELAKAEVTIKAKSLGGAVAAAAIAGVFAFLALILVLHGLAWLVADLFSDGIVIGIWLGFFITAVLLLVLGAVAGLLALRFFRSGTPPTPELAIEEARKTRATIEEVRS
ncbi:MAG: phage holin family protein [Thermoleophilaceae bacterium]|nr:phage holin family protein [Actinomycetota bacterium]